MAETYRVPSEGVTQGKDASMCSEAISSFKNWEEAPCRMRDVLGDPLLKPIVLPQWDSATILSVANHLQVSTTGPEGQCPAHKPSARTSLPISALMWRKFH